MKRLLREPLIHFLLIGAVLFGLYGITQSGRPASASSKEIRLSVDEISQLVTEGQRGGRTRSGQIPPLKCLSSLLPALFGGLSMLLGCAAARSPIRTEAHVDLERFMGDWYVIANIPTFLEEGAHNAIESYRLADDGTIDTTFTFRQDSFGGEPKGHEPCGFLFDTQSNAVWGMQFVWPIKADYRIVYVSEDYTQTVIGRESRDYVWIMARTPSIPDADYESLVDLVKSQGYATDRLRKVPQRWPAP